MKNELKFREDGCFKIVQFTDIHWQNGEPVDQQSAALMESVAQAEAPDLIVLTGDILSGGGCDDAAESLRQIIEILERCGFPWAAVFGNHDDEGTANRHELMQVMQESDLSLAEPGPEDIPGVGNYVLTIESSDKTKSAALLYFVDSGSYAPTDIGGYDWIRRAQIEWYLSESKRYTASAGNPMPALAFFHIPIPEYDEVWDFHTCYGAKYEKVCPPLINSGFFAALHEAGDVMGTFVGHEHINDFWGDLHGIRLCYGRTTGFNCYGKEGFPRGARVIQLREGERQFETWLHLENGTIVNQQQEHKPLQRTLTED
ncbi:MAG: metallophosphoesterase family protein [Candidatus Poribacteria bacterium]|nr:metallophosphoesterase family protein [Candidatus Poribacteria bacterium]